MPILLKKKAAPAAIVPSAPAPTRRATRETAAPVVQVFADDTLALIEAIGAHQPEVEKVKADLKTLGLPVEAQAKRMKELQALIDAMDDTNPDEPIEIRATAFAATAGKRAVERSLKPGALMKILAFVGEETFLQIIDIPLGKLDDYLTLAQRNEVLDETRGRRGKLKVQALA